MINFKRYQLTNGLRIVAHYDPSTPMVAINLLYDVGSRDEEEKRTGFAHLFEHLMFGGSENVADFDLHMQMAGGENNAFTNADITNYYDIVPGENIETALWLESDRMKNLVINHKSLDIQKKVVVEEFKETCLNTPYGDAWHNLLSLAFSKHPYRWPTIGILPDHVKSAKLENVKNFFDKYYKPNNAILSLAGNIEEKETFRLVEKWFGEIPKGEDNLRTLPEEPVQTKMKTKIIQAHVPARAIYMAFHMPGRNHEDYFRCDVLSDILGSGRSSRLFQRLHKDQRMFNQIDAYITGNADPGLFIIEGKLNANISPEEAVKSIWNELNLIVEEPVGEEELQKVKNKIENSLLFSEVNVLNKAISLAYFEWLGDVNLINKQINSYESINPVDVHEIATKIFTQENCSLIIYDPE